MFITNEKNWFTQDFKNIREHVQFLSELRPNSPNLVVNGHENNMKKYYRSKLLTEKLKYKENLIGNAPNLPK